MKYETIVKDRKKVHGIKVYKKAFLSTYKGKVIVTLFLPFNNQLVHLSDDGRKCRAEVAYVLAIESVKKIGGKYDTYSKASSTWDLSFHYRVGRKVTPTKPFHPSRNACSSGVHFFFTRREAEEY